MRFSFSRRLLQNIFLLLALCSVVSVLFLFRLTIESFATQVNFFWVVVAATVATAMALFLLSIINYRVAALAESRTENLLETQKLFVELYRNSPVPYVLIDRSGKVTYPNHAAVRLFGFVDAQFEGQNIFDLFAVTGDEGGSKPALIASRFKSGVFVENRDITVLRTDGTTRFGLLSIFPYGSGGSKAKGLVTVVDITKQKEIENAKSEFVSLASHQLRTPVSSLRWNLELLKSAQFGTLSEGQLEYYHKIVNAVGKMNNIIEDFLSVSQLELGVKAVSSQSVILSELCKDVCEEFTGRVAEKQLTLEQVYDERVSTIETDKRLLHMVVSNLVSNATKYTPEKGTVRLQYVGTAEGITITVSDTGMGIPLSDQEKLFTKFHRATNARETVMEGTGLGLYIVKLAVEKIGGSIGLQSEEGVGSVFTVVLPISNKGRMV